MSLLHSTFFMPKLYFGILITLTTHFTWADDLTHVDVYQPQSSIHQQILSLSGSVEAEQNAELASLQAGLVAELFVEEGDKVTAGQKLLTLDTTLAQLSFAEVKAALDVAKISFKEAQRLYKEVIALSKKKLVAKTLIAERQAQVASANAELTKQQASLALKQEIVNQHTLYAPFSGTISKRNANLGEWISQQSQVFTLVQQSELRLKIAIPQQYYGVLAKKHDIEVKIHPDTINSKPLSANLTRLVAVSNQQSRTFTAYIKLPLDSGLIAGMSAKAEVILPQNSNLLVWLPKSAIKQHPDGGSSVFTVVNNKAKRVLVSIIDQQDDLVAITQTVPNQQYIVSGVALLRDGSELKINKVKGKSL